MQGYSLSMVNIDMIIRLTSSARLITFPLLAWVLAYYLVSVQMSLLILGIAVSDSLASVNLLSSNPHAHLVEVPVAYSPV